MGSYWFVSWQEVSNYGSIFKCSAIDHHPFKLLANLQRRNEKSSVNVIYTLISFRKIESYEYELAEKAGII